MTRLQYNIRLDNYPELHSAAKAKAKEEGVSMNDFGINALKAALGWEESPTSALRAELAEMLAPLEQRLAALEEEAQLQQGKSQEATRR